jgi:exopolysaccharide biosynthesis polyprenyl glycosylphosphotransferase
MHSLSKDRNAVNWPFEAAVTGQNRAKMAEKSYARLIPGSGFAVPTPDVRAKRKAQSVRIDRTLWTAVAPERIVAPKSDPLRFLSPLFPQPKSSHLETNLGASVLADIAITVLAGTIVLGVGKVLAPWIGALLAAQVWNFLVWILLQGALVTLIGHSEGLYWSDRAPKSAHVAIRLAKSSLWATMVIGLAAPSQVRFAIVASAVVAYLAMLGWRRCGVLRFGKDAAADSRACNVLIIGTGAAAQGIASYFQKHVELQRKVIGFLTDQRTNDLPVLGRIADLQQIARSYFIDKVIISLEDPRAALLAVRMSSACHLDVDLLSDITPYSENCCVSQVDRWPLVHVNQENPPELSLTIKRALDIIGAAVGLAVSGPLMAILGLWIKLDSPGPAFYSALRVGRKGIRFRCYKLRTMAVNADSVKDQLRNQNQREGPFFKIAHDPRITRCGEWLRKYSLDELPQLWNVLRGDMSLVGPRPHPLDDVAGYEVVDLCRLDVRPGLTGLWQTSARSDPSFRTNMRLDREYIELWSLALDFRILFKTLRVVAAGGGC